MGGWSDDGGGSSGWECRWGGEEGNEIVCNETPVSVRDRELASAGSGTINYSRDMDIKCCKTLCTWIEQAVCREDYRRGWVISGEQESNIRKNSLWIKARDS